MDSLDDHWMRLALAEAVAAGESGEVPVGAVLVLGGEVVGRGRNRRVMDRDPLAHAEIVALRDASRTLGQWRFDAAALYVTLEPCPMCAGAIVQSRVGSLKFGAFDARGGGVRSFYQICDDPRGAHRVRVVSGILAAPCAQVLSDFFAAARRKDL